MGGINTRIEIKLSADQAFQKFVQEFNEWWPKEYTWSKDKLKNIRIDGQQNGLCTEIGPHGFRCDWGRVTAFRPNEEIGLKWQISVNREPIPNPENASDLKISFLPNGDSTILEFEHFNFDNHKEGADKYRQMMNSKHGWPYILNNFKAYCEK